MKPLKSIITIILLCAIIAPVAMQVAGFFRLSGMQKNYKERLRCETLHTITIPQNDIVWAKPGKEIWYQGRMFDIKETLHRDGMVTFKGLFDDEEKELKQKLAHEAKTASGKKASQNLTHMFMTGLFVQPMNDIYTCTGFSQPVQKNSAGFITSCYASISSGTPAPPPRLAS